MKDDPLTAMLARSLGEPVERATSETLPPVDGVERERVRFTVNGASRALVFQRYPVDAALEVQLLPFLARKSDRVPRVHARGIPPVMTRARSWLLVEDLVDAPDACDDPAGIDAAMREIERAVARDVPALRALGVGGAGTALIHGDLRCVNAKHIDRGIVIVGWSHARLGQT